MWNVDHLLVQHCITIAQDESWPQLDFFFWDLKVILLSEQHAVKFGWLIGCPDPELLRFMCIFKHNSKLLYLTENKLVKQTTWGTFGSFKTASTATWHSNWTSSVLNQVNKTFCQFFESQQSVAVGLRKSLGQQLLESDSFSFNLGVIALTVKFCKWRVVLKNCVRLRMVYWLYFCLHKDGLHLGHNCVHLFEHRRNLKPARVFAQLEFPLVVFN